MQQEKNKLAAQRRVDQINAYRAELTELEQADLLRLTPEQKAAIDAYHQQLCSELTEQFDVDLSQNAKQLSLGMQIVSFLGALALAASVFFLFYQYWGYFSVTAQCAILFLAPLLTLISCYYIRRLEPTGYFAKLAALISLACFVLNISMLGQIFNMVPTPNAMLLWAAYALLLAYALHVRLLLAFAIFCIYGFFAAKIGTWSGLYWLDMGERPENFLLPTLLMFWVPSLVKQQRYHGFTTIYHVLSMIGFFLVILILSNWGRGSYLSWDRDWVEGTYQVLGFVFSAAAVYLGLINRWRHVMLTGNVFFALFLYAKFFDWWWDWMPKYIFFFIIGLTAILVLLIFKRLRRVELGAAV